MPHPTSDSVESPEQPVAMNAMISTKQSEAVLERILAPFPPISTINDTDSGTQYRGSAEGSAEVLDAPAASPPANLTPKFAGDVVPSSRVINPNPAGGPHVVGSFGPSGICCTCSIL